MKKVYEFMKTEQGSWKSPKYVSSCKKAVEMLESDQYKDVLLESDFWQLTGKTKKGTIAYNGLIISHNGCLKINDALPEEKRFRAECMSLDKDGYAGSLVFTYICPDQGIYEVGEVSKANCTNAYPYAMALKRCMDRVILKNSRLAYDGIMSDSEAEEFRNEPKEDTAPVQDQTPVSSDPVREQSKDEYTVVLPDGAMENPRAALVNFAKDHGLNINNIAKHYKLNNGSKPEEFLRALAELVANEMEEGTV